MQSDVPRPLVLVPCIVELMIVIGRAVDRQGRKAGRLRKCAQKEINECTLYGEKIGTHLRPP